MKQHKEKRALLGVMAFVLCLITTHAQIHSQSDATARKFDEFGDIHYGEASARLDAFALELHNQNAKGYVIVYGGRDRKGRESLPGMSCRYALRVKNYLLTSRGLAPDRIVALVGGQRGELTHETWVVPAGATPPTPTPPDAATALTTDSSRPFDLYVVPFPDDTDFDSWDGRHEDHSARLDSFARTLKRNSEARAYIVVNAGGMHEYKPVKRRVSGNRREYVYVPTQKFGDPFGTDRKVAAAEKRYLVERHGIAPSRITAFGAGYSRPPKPYIRDPNFSAGDIGKNVPERYGIFIARTATLWIVSRGERPPVLTRNAYPLQRRTKRQ